MTSMQVIVRYTFLDIAEPQNGSLRRCSSTPATPTGALADKLFDFSCLEGAETSSSSSSTATSQGLSPKTKRSTEGFSGSREPVSTVQQCAQFEDSTGGTCNAVVASGDSGSTLRHGSQVGFTQLELASDKEDEIKKIPNKIPNLAELKTAACDEDVPMPIAPLWRQPPQCSAAPTQDQRIRQLNALDLCDASMPVFCAAARSRATGKGQIQSLQPRWLVAAEAAQRTSILQTQNLFGGSLRKLKPTKRKNSLGDVSPFTSDEEVEPLRYQTKLRAHVTPANVAAPSRVCNVSDVEEWPDTDDEFEKSLPLDGTAIVAAASAQPQQVFPIWTTDSEATWQPCHTCATITPPLAYAPSPPGLNRNAKRFSPALAAVAEFHAVVANMKFALLSTLHVLCVEVKEDEGPSCATMFISLIDCCDFATEMSATIQSAKEALLNAAALTQGTYVFGYATEPFRDIGEEGFEATLAHCPPSKEKHACWDTFQTGACPRKGACRWYHPHRSDKRKIRVVIEED